MIYCIYHSPIGPIHIQSDGKAITGLYLLEQKFLLGEDALEDRTSPILSTACHWLDEYFQGKAPDPKWLPLQPVGTKFQQQVWQLLLQVSYGETVTYGDLAGHFGPKMSAQAVGQAVGRNPISIIIPCHRVMGSSNRLTGYAGGIKYKVWLLTHEGLDPQTFK